MQASTTSSRNRPTNRVVFEYPVHKNGETEFEEIPFIIGILANFSGMRKQSDQEAQTKRFIDVRPGSINELMKCIRPKLQIGFDNRLSPESGRTELICELEFESLQDLRVPSSSALGSLRFRNLHGQP